MSFLALLLALLLEQARPLPTVHALQAGLRAWLVSVRRTLDEGRWSVPAQDGDAQPQTVHEPSTDQTQPTSSVQAPSMSALGASERLGAALVWLAAVLAPVALVWVVYAALSWVGWPLALVFNALVLYLCLGLGRLGVQLQGVRAALAAHDEPSARAQLRQCQTALPVAADELVAQPRTVPDIAHAAAAHMVLLAHQRVFGVLFWFTISAALGAGPVGAVLYCLAQRVQRLWTGEGAPVSVPTQRMSDQAWQLLDWAPARATALGLAIVGSFEDVMDAWRTYAATAPERVGQQRSNTLILAAASAATGLPLQCGDAGSSTPATSAQDDDGLFAAALQTLRRALNHVWRLTVVWLIVLALLLGMALN